MEKNEAQMVIEILLSADGGCETCAYHLIAKFIEKFPQYTELTEDKYVEEFGIDSWQEMLEIFG